MKPTNNVVEPFKNSMVQEEPAMKSTNNVMKLSTNSALQFVILLGIVSLFADMTYEGARSITGPYLAVLGASGTVVGIVAGFGELVGYGLRLVSGYISDRTGRYWAVTIVGYVVNLFAVPLLALAGHWEVAAVLMITERAGKAMRVPPRDAMLSHATEEMGRGWGFGLHEAMDQIGAVLGPLVVAATLFFRQGNQGYKIGFAVLLVPAVLAIGVLLIARRLYPRPRDFEVGTDRLEGKGLSRAFWIYLAAVSVIAIGYVDFPLIAYHFQKSAVTTAQWIPLLYALAMAVDALAALIFGRLFDQIGFSLLVGAAVLSAFFAPFVFLGGFRLAIVGMCIWGIGMGAQESVMRAAVAEMVAANRRAAAYGIFNAGYGLFWFAGSTALGILYDVSIPALVIFSVVTQLISVPIFLWVRRVWH